MGLMRVAESGAPAKISPAQVLLSASSSTPISSSKLGKKGRKLIIPIEVTRFESQTVQ